MCNVPILTAKPWTLRRSFNSFKFMGRDFPNTYSAHNWRSPSYHKVKEKFTIQGTYIFFIFTIEMTQKISTTQAPSSASSPSSVYNFFISIIWKCTFIDHLGKSCSEKAMFPGWTLIYSQRQIFSQFSVYSFSLSLGFVYLEILMFI